MVEYGAGTKYIDEVANILRIMAGQSLETPHSHDEVGIVETNIDDVTGEVIGRAAERLMSQGARDVTITPVYMKKNRPGHVSSVIAKKEDAEDLAQVLSAETGTHDLSELKVKPCLTA